MRNRRIKFLLVACAVVVLIGSAAAFSNIFLFQGAVASYDFGVFGGVQPGTVELNAFTMKPGDVVPWHYHKGLSYVIVVRGTVTEQELNQDNTCGAVQQDAAGSAFVEPPGRRHTVSNPGPGVAIIYWATVFPQGDPNGDAVFLDPQPTCN